MKSETYEEFIKKFNKEKTKTTDDCYTPKDIYEKVKKHFINYYNLNNYEIVRPFYPGGDYENEEYKENQVVLDNPPFSILMKIVKYYNDNNIKFILFAPTFYSFNYLKYNITIHFIEETLIYENGAEVPTCFITNLENENSIISDLELSNELKENKEKRERKKTKLPDNYINPGQFKKYIKYGINIKKNDIINIASRTPEGRRIFGSAIIVKEDNIPWEKI